MIPNSALFIDGRYEALAPLGQGTSGEVYRALDHKTRQMLALKFLKQLTHSTSSIDVVKGFKKEFEILKNFNHPYIAKIFDFGFDRTTNQYYFTEEFIDGEDLWRATEKLPTEMIEDLFVQTLRALEFLHSRGVYHLDLKPSNILILPGKPPRLKVIDFGLAPFRGSDVILGTPAYTAPEVILRLPRGAPADLYSAASIFYKCFTRQNPFQAGEIQETWNRHLRLKPPPPSSLREVLPNYLDIILLNLLEKNPSDRYGRAAYVIRSLNHLSGKNYPIETGETFASYLPEEGRLIGRTTIWFRLTELFERQFRALALRKGPPRVATTRAGVGHPSSKHLRVVLLFGGPGTGKTRLLKELKYHAQLNEVPVFDLEVATPQEPSLILGDLGPNLSEKTRGELIAKLQNMRAGLTVLAVATQEDLKWLKAGVPQAAAIELKNFSLEEVALYVVSLTGLRRLPIQLIQQFHRHSEGNPRLLKEIIKRLMEMGELLDLEGHLDIRALEDIQVPWEKIDSISLLEELFSSRWKKMPTDFCNLLTFLGLLGRSATVFELRSIQNRWKESTLQELLKLGWVIKRPRGEVTISNPSFGRYIVRSLSEEDKVSLHDAIAEMLKKTQVPPSWELDYHRGFGGGPNASDSLLQYATGCFAREEWESAKRALDRSASLGANESQWAPLLLEWVHHLRGSQKISEAREALGLLKTTSLPQRVHWQVEVALEEILLDLQEKKFAQAKGHLHSLFEGHHNKLPTVLFLRGKNMEARLLMEEAKLELAEQIFQKNFEEWLKLDDEQKKNVTNNDLATCLFLKQEYQRSWEHLQLELAFYRRIGDPFLLGRRYYQLGSASLKLGKTVEAISYLKKCVLTGKRIDHIDLLLRADNELGNLYFSQNQLPEALMHYEHALHLAQRLKDHSAAAVIATNLGMIHGALGQESQCFSFLQFGLRLLGRVVEKSTDDWMSQARALLELSRYYQRRDQTEEAKQVIEEAYAIAKEETALKSLLPEIAGQHELLLGYLKEVPEPPKEAAMPSTFSAPPTQEALQKTRELTKQILENLKAIEKVVDQLAAKISSLGDDLAPKVGKKIVIRTPFRRRFMAQRKTLRS